MGALGRLSLLKSYPFLNETASTYDDAFKYLLRQVTDFVNVYTGRALESATYTEQLYTGDNTDVLFLRNWPVTALTTVALWDGDDSWDTETASYYLLCEDRYIQYPALGQSSSATWSNWQSSYRNGIKITYTAGYANSTTYAITAAVIATKKFTIAGDYTSTFTAGEVFDVTGSTLNDGTYTVVSSELVATATVITVSEAVASATADGSITASWDTASIVNSLFGVPPDLEYAACKIAMLAWLDSKTDDARMGVTSKSMDVAGALSYEKFITGIPDDIKMILDQYRTNPI